MALELAEDGGITRPKFLDKALRFRKIALILAFTAAYFYSQWCFHPANMEVTRISEHSLMPGLVTPRFDKSGVAIQIFRKLSQLAKTKSQQSFIRETFSELGLQSYTQKWRSTIAAVPMSGENVYGFVRGHRNDGAEAQLIVVQLGTSERARKMISRMLAFVDYAKDQVYWARDLVFVFVDGGVDTQEESVERAALALDAFLLKYQRVESISSEQNRRRSVVADEIPTQTGALIAGVVYDLSGMAVKEQHIVSLQTNGINGQQVNLDVFNGIVKIADSKHSSKVAVFGTIHRHLSRWMEESPFDVPLRAIYTQAFRSIEGIHSVMGKYGVQGLTVGLSNDYSEKQTGQFVEEVSRMLNNVLERLHQSYFMYVQSDDMHFASVAFFMPVISILLVPLVLSAYFEWTRLEMFQIPFAYLALHLLGFVLYLSTACIYATVGEEFVLQLAEFPFVGVDGCDGQLTAPIPLIPLFVLVSCAPIGLFVFWKQPVGCIRSVRIMCLLESSLAIGSLALINFGLTTFVAGVSVPIVFLMTYESREKKRCIVRTILLTILSPVAVMTYLAMHVPWLFGIRDAAADRSVAEHGLTSYLVRALLSQHLVFGANHFFVMCTAGYPVWNMLFACAMHHETEEEPEEATETFMTPPSDPTKHGKKKRR